MSVERGIPQFGENFSSSPRIEKVRRDLDFAEELHKFNDPEESFTDLSERINDGAYPVIYANHTQHMNIVALRGAYNRLTTRPKDLYIAVASSLGSGLQDEGLGSFANSIEQILKEESVHFIPLTRLKDIRKYHKDSTREEKRRIIGETEANKDKIFRSLSEDAGFLFFPETTTEGGVKDETGKRKGLQPVDNKLFSELLEKANELGRDIAFLPLGIINANNIIEPRQTNPTLKAKIQYVKSRATPFSPSKLAQVNLGKIFSSQQLFKYGIDVNDRHAVNDFMMRRVAELLPEEARGYYR